MAILILANVSAHGKPTVPYVRLQFLALVEFVLTFPSLCDRLSPPASHARHNLKIQVDGVTHGGCKAIHGVLHLHMASAHAR